MKLDLKELRYTYPNKVLIVFILLLLTACGKTERYSVSLPVDTVTNPVVQDEVLEVVEEVNELRVAQGQLPLSLGLTCNLYNNTGSSGVFPTSATSFPTTLPSVTASWTFVGAFNQEDSSVSSGVNVMPTALRSVYKTDYAIRCTGQYVAPKSDYYYFELRSDDAALLYIGNTLVTGLNTLHAPTTTTGVKFLNRGIHSFRLDYMQDGGQMALKLNVSGDRLYR